jgi:hypothetical protein
VRKNITAATLTAVLALALTACGSQGLTEDKVEEILNDPKVEYTLGDDFEAKMTENLEAHGYTREQWDEFWAKYWEEHPDVPEEVKTQVAFAALSGQFDFDALESSPEFSGQGGTGVDSTQSGDVPNSEKTPTDPADPEFQEMNQVLTKGEEFYYFGSSGEVGKFKLPGEPVADAEEARKYVDAPEVTYVTVSIDNRQGTEGTTAGGINAFDADGRKYEFTDLSTQISEWQDMLPQDPEWDTALSTEDYNRYIDLHNKYLHGVDVGEVKDIVLVYAGAPEDLPEEFTRIEVLESGTAFPGVEATPVSFAKEFADPTVLESLDFKVPED